MTAAWVDWAGLVYIPRTCIGKPSGSCLSIARGEVYLRLIWELVQVDVRDAVPRSYASRRLHFHYLLQMRSTSCTKNHISGKGKSDVFLFDKESEPYAMVRTAIESDLLPRWSGVLRFLCYRFSTATLVIMELCFYCSGIFSFLRCLVL